ncbi:MAG TPA: DUF998 domain-containing protein [Actinomycetes bacterium]|jgi:hypothetical protein|nr:DUF998 domain-containing protein [Actinomycetes bacterium]
MTIVGLSPAGAAPRAVSTRTLLACGAIAGPLFTVAWAVEGATRARYHPLRHPVSSLELGDFGWTQRANFIVAGLLTLAFASGLWRALRPLGGSTWGPLLVAAHAIGLLGAGVFVTDPVSGYPPGTPDHLQTYGSVHAALHDLFSVGTFVGLPVACLVVARRLAGWGQRGWAIYSAATGVIFAVAFVLSSMAFNQAETLVELGGLLQRITITVGWSWLTLLAVHLLRGLPEPPTRRPSQ